MNIEIETRTSVYDVRVKENNISVLKTEIKNGRESDVPVGAHEMGDKLSFVPYGDTLRMELLKEGQVFLLTSPIQKIRQI